MIRAFVLSVVFLVAAYDTIVGIYLLAAREPYRVNGGDAMWARRTPALWGGDDSPLLRSLFRRLGAFSLHTGVVTAAWAVAAREDPRMLTALLVVYTLTGLAFFANDRAYFRGTRYFLVKQALGALWAAALVAQVTAVWR